MDQGVEEAWTGMTPDGPVTVLPLGQWAEQLQAVVEEDGGVLGETAYDLLAWQAEMAYPDVTGRPHRNRLRAIQKPNKPSKSNG
jgi:hypothetical protein